jgi:hypothetical protein
MIEKRFSYGEMKEWDRQSKWQSKLSIPCCGKMFYLPTNY